jgi:mannonate dehydratase
MTRRNLLQCLAAPTLLRGMPSPRIKDIQVIATAAAGLRLTIVKVLTDQDGLHGYGCATFTQRADLVAAAVDRYLQPFLVGKAADRIGNIWHECYNSSYWCNDAVLNNALSGVDLALWDIKARQAGVPVYQVLGGKCREAVECYVHAGGNEIEDVIASARRFQSEGFRHIRVQVGVPNQAAYSSGGGRSYGGGSAPVSLGRAATNALHDEPMLEPAAYIRRTSKLFEACRKQLGDEVEILHDTHERILPTQALQFVRDAEQYKLFFLEDVV